MKLGGGFRPIYIAAQVMRSNLSSDAHLFKPVISEIVQDPDFFDWHLEYCLTNDFHSRRPRIEGGRHLFPSIALLSFQGWVQPFFRLTTSSLRERTCNMGKRVLGQKRMGTQVASRRNSAQIACLKPNNCKTSSISLHFTSSAHAPDSRAGYLSGD